VIVSVSKETTMELHEDAKVMKWVGEKKGRPYAIVKNGDELSHDEGRWIDRYRSIDREADRYDEVIRDKATGEIIREVHQPLSQHRDRGSARPNRRKQVRGARGFLP
jgi:hypothetical protein